MKRPLNILSLHESPAELQTKLGEKAKTLRLFQGFKRVSLSEKSGVSPETIRNFEQTGKVNLENFIRISFALNEGHKLGDLFDLPEIASLQDIKQLEKPVRKRGKR